MNSASKTQRWSQDPSKFKFNIGSFPQLLMASRDKLLYPGIVGLFSFLTVVGYERLLPSNIGWISHTVNPDTLQQHLGWELFRNSDWSFPPGINTGILGGKTSIVYSGGIPLIELPLKLIEERLTEPFQYLGIWLLICFMLQAISTFQLFSRFSELGKYEKLIMASAFCFSPILLWRVNLHLGLTAHFLIIFALGLCLDAKVRLRTASWICLLTASLLIHGYFFVMCSLMALAAIATSVHSSSGIHKFTLALRKLIRVFILPSLTAYLVGYFASSSGWNSGFPNHLFKMDLTQPLNITGQSWIVSGIAPETSGNPEGFNFLGIWVFISALFLTNKLRGSIGFIREVLSKNRPLVVVLLIMFLYALTNHISLLRFQFVIPLPDRLDDLFEIFRASGRFFWPLVYAAYMVITVLLVKYVKRQKRVYVLLFLAIVHIGDSSYYWKSINDINNKKFNNQITVSPSLNSVLKHGGYEEIVYVPEFADAEKIQECFAWERIGQLAVQFGLATNCTFLARYDLREMESFGERVKVEVESGKLNRSRIYILKGGYPFESYKNPCTAFLGFEGMTLLLPLAECKK